MKIAIAIREESRNPRKPQTSMRILIHSYMLHSRFGQTTQVFYMTDKRFPQLDPSVAEQIKFFSPDIIECQGRFAAIISFVDAFPSVPIVGYIHGVLSNYNSNLKAHKFPEGKSMDRIFHYIFVSDYARRNWKSYYPQLKGKTSVVHNALLTEGWFAEDSEKENIILFCARLMPEKGIEQFIEAAAAIRSEFPQWRFVVVVRKRNADYYLQQETAFKNALGAQGEWITNASREQVQVWNRKARIGITPSNWDEAFCLSLLEMHLARCAVISSGRGGMKEVSGPDGALYLKEVSGTAIAEGLRFLINNLQEREALAKRGHQYVMRNHNIQDRVAQLDDLRCSIVRRFKEQNGRGFIYKLNQIRKLVFK